MNLPNIIQINLQNYVATVLDDTESMTSVDVTNFRGKLFDVILNVALTMLRRKGSVFHSCNNSCHLFVVGFLLVPRGRRVELVSVSLSENIFMMK